MAKLDKLTLSGIVLCALPVASFSAYSQFETMRLSGVPWQLAWVLPVATDASGMVATRVWINPEFKDGVRRYAALIALASIALAFGGAAAHLAFGADQPMPWGMRLVVGGLPSLALAALVHLIALISADKKATPKAAVTTPKKSKAAPKAAGGAERNRPPTSSAPSVSTPNTSTEIGFELNAASANTSSVEAPEVGKGSTRQQMLAYLDRHGEVSGAELDRLFKTNNYGRGVVNAWRKAHPQAVGE